MNDIITIGREENLNKIICPHCKNLIPIDLNKIKDISKVFKDKCPSCNGQNFIGILILSDKSLLHLSQNIQVVTETLETRNKLYGGKRIQ